MNIAINREPQNPKEVFFPKLATDQKINIPSNVWYIRNFSSINYQSPSEYVYVRPHLQFSEERQKTVDIVSLTNVIIIKLNKKKLIESKSE